MYGGIFKPRGKQYLDFMFVPPQIPHREEELNILLDNLTPVLEGDVNAYTIPVIYGRTGTGKTTVAKKLLEAIEKKDTEIILNRLMVNCVSYSKPYNLSRYVTQYLTEIPTRGYSYQELMQMTYDTLELRDEYLFLILDDVDELIRSDKGRFLHLLTRLDEAGDKKRILPLLIARKMESINDLPGYIRNKLNGPILHFEPYNVDEMSDIIQDRVKLALNDDAISKNAVSSIAYISSALEGGDARTALTLLLNSGNIAERLRANRITVEHVRKAYEHLPGYSYRPIGHFIDERTIKILQVIAEFLSQYPDEFILSEKMLRAVRSEVAKRYKITLSHNDFIETLDRMVEARLVNKYMNKYLWISISIDSIMNLLAEYFK